MRSVRAQYSSNQFVVVFVFHGSEMPKPGSQNLKESSGRFTRKPCLPRYFLLLSPCCYLGAVIFVLFSLCCYLCGVIGLLIVVLLSLCSYLCAVVILLLYPTVDGRRCRT